MRLTSISREETLRYMGHKGEVPPALGQILDETENLIKEKISPKYVYRAADTEIDGNTVKITGFPSIIESNSLAEHLKGCAKVIVMAVTLTAEADKLINRAEITDMAKAYTLDAMCSSAVETACDLAESEIISELGVNYTTWRYSAGYGDLKLTYQRDFIKYLNAEKRIGLTLTAENLMIPRKSVTAVIGVSDTPIEKKHRSCLTCNMRKNCPYNRDGHCR